MDWYGSEHGREADEQANDYWPAGLSDGETTMFSMMRITLTVEMAEQGATERGELPDLTELRVTDEERAGLLAEQLDLARALAKKRREKFFVEAQDLSGATFRVERGFRGRKSQRLRMTISDLGVVDVRPVQ